MDVWHEWEKLFKDRKEKPELKARRDKYSGEIRYDRVERSGEEHDHEWFKVNRYGQVSEGAAIWGRGSHATNEDSSSTGYCPKCGATGPYPGVCPRGCRE